MAVLVALLVALAGAVLAGRSEQSARGAPGPGDGSSPDRSAPAGHNGGAQHSRPDVVLVLTDDQRFDTLRGMQQTRKLLVDRGRTFTNAMNPTPLCCPSRASLLTGWTTNHTGVWDNGDLSHGRWGGFMTFRRNGLERKTIGVAMHDAGYRTGFFGKYLNGFGRAAARGHRPPGWDTFVGFVARTASYYGYDLTDGSHHGYAPSDYSTDVLAGSAARFVADAPDRQPLFLILSVYAPHTPYTPAPRDAVPLRTLIPDAGPWDPDRAGKPRWVRNHSLVRSYAAWQVRTMQTQSLGAVDDAVAGLLGELRRSRPGRPDPLVVLTSDNGFQWGEHGILGKDLPYDESTRVPLVLRWDGHVAPGSVDRRLALNVDVTATVAAAGGATMPGRDGHDLLGSTRRDGLVLEATTGYGRRPAYCGWRTANRAFVHWATGEEELYLYDQDPAEHLNRAHDPALRHVVEAMRRLAREACSPTPPGFSWSRAR